ncbi:hypothetical protein M404DRAFT_481405 [Pisolithus tinctorius Marx 270]|uniref:Uncharacterized protein n=1 Tax=Pisolithus tinctorius Marx 270 TaxID=870435 RepID=A0A0C3NZX4_PISTI|nr:hypothetical protein M404DRAFT_481405 [Pisolithus tinctorius Marx 270]
MSPSCVCCAVRSAQAGRVVGSVQWRDEKSGMVVIGCHAFGPGKFRKYFSGALTDSKQPALLTKE